MKIFRVHADNRLLVASSATVWQYTLCGVGWCHAGRVNKPMRETWSPLAGSTGHYGDPMYTEMWWSNLRGERSAENT